MNKLKVNLWLAVGIIFLFTGGISSCNKLNLFGDEATPEEVDVAFTHPGILIDSNDIEWIRGRALSGMQPWAGSYQFLKQTVDQQSMSGPYSIVERTGGNNSPEANALSSDSQLAYRSAILWFITQDTAYATKAIQVLDGWSSTLTSLTGGDSKLMAAWYGFCLVNAAEILKHTDSGWSMSGIEQTEQMFLDVFYPLIENWQRGRAGNWDTAITKTIMAFAVFLDDEEMFNGAVDFFYSTTENSNGTLNKNIYPSGQNFESGRDQTHAQMGLVGLAESCEIGWKQGLDMYSAMDNRLLKGFEYTAKYNLGFDDVPYEQNVYGNVISATGRGSFQAMYEMVYNHYVNRKGMTAIDLPYTTQVVAKIRSEQEGERGTAIFPGFGSLLFNAPAGVINVDSITVNSEDFRLVVGGERRLQARVSPWNATEQEVIWSSADTTVARVDGEGKVQAIGTGATTISVSSPGSSYAKQLTVTIITASEAEKAIAIDYAFVQGGAGQDQIWDASDSLIVRKGTKATHEMVAYLKFDLTGSANQMSTVCLELYTRVGSQNGGIKVLACDDPSWIGNTMTHRTKPPLGPLIATQEIVGQAPQRILIDVTDYIKAHLVTSQIVSFGLTADVAA